MAKQLTQYQVARMARKSSDIARLASEYKNNLNDVATQYQTSFDTYQKKRAEIMAPYEAASAKYKEDYSAFETASGAYKQKLSDYQKRLQDSIDNPKWDRFDYSMATKPGTGGSTKWAVTPYGNFTLDNLPSGIRAVQETRYGPVSLYKLREAPKFTDVAPTAPTAPEAPKIEEFNTAEFDAKRAEVDSNYKRELGERRASRASAVSRKQARPLLQGA